MAPANSPRVGVPARRWDGNDGISLWLGYGWLPVKHAERPVFVKPQRSTGPSPSVTRTALREPSMNGTGSG